MDAGLTRDFQGIACCQRVYSGARSQSVRAMQLVRQQLQPCSPAASPLMVPPVETDALVSPRSVLGGETGRGGIRTCSAAPAATEVVMGSRAPLPRLGCRHLQATPKRGFLFVQLSRTTCTCIWFAGSIPCPTRRSPRVNVPRPKSCPARTVGRPAGGQAGRHYAAGRSGTLGRPWLALVHDMHGSVVTDLIHGQRRHSCVGSGGHRVVHLDLDGAAREGGVERGSERGAGRAGTGGRALGRRVPDPWHVLGAASVAHNIIARLPLTS